MSFARHPLRRSRRVHLRAQQRGDPPGCGDGQRAARHGDHRPVRRAHLSGHCHRVWRTGPARAVSDRGGRLAGRTGHRAFRVWPLLQLQIQPADGGEPLRPRRSIADRRRDRVGRADPARDLYRAAGARLCLDAGRLVRHPAQRRWWTEGAGVERRASVSAANRLGLYLRARRSVGYGTSPLMAREAFLAAPDLGTAAGGCIAYASATLSFALILFKPSSWADIRNTSRENLPWFLSGAVTVAISQAFVYASLAAAPLMVVTPILQLSLVFRLGLSQWINSEHEVMNTAVIVGAFTAVAGSLLVSIPTDVLARWLDLPPTLGDFLSYRLAPG